MWSAADLERALHEGEGQHVEFKQETELPHDIAECLAAFANATGGTMIFGVAEDPLTVVGVRKLKQVRANIVRAAHKIVTPPLPVEITTLDYGDQTLLVATVGPGQDVYQAGGRFLQRHHDQNLTIPPDRLRALMVARGLLIFESLPVAGATLTDLDLDRVASHIRRLASQPVRQLGLPPAPAQTPLDFLRARQAVVDQAGTLVPSVVGLLMFGPHPQGFLPQATITVTVFAGRDTSQGYQDNVEILGSLTVQIDATLDYLWGQIRHGGRFTGASTREDMPEYPRAVLRELLVNAVAHRDYSIAGSKIRIALFSDRLELVSPGGLAGHITLENILREQYSRNPRLVRLLLEEGYIEERGMGLDNVYYWLDNEGRPLPELEETGGSLIVTLSSPLAHDYPTGIASDSSGARPLLAQPVNPTQRAILDYLGQEEAASMVDLQKRLPMRSRRALTYDLQELMSWGLVERTGAGPATRYRLPPGFSPRTNAR